jgi:hypothetical protein
MDLCQPRVDQLQAGKNLATCSRVRKVCGVATRSL